MKRKSCTPSRTEIKKYVLRKRPHTFKEKDFDKIFEDMKNQIINGIKKATENRINEQKEILLNYINTCEIIDRIQLPSTVNPKKSSKKRKSSKNVKEGIALDNLEPSSNKKGRKKSKSKINKIQKDKKDKKGKSKSVIVDKKKKKIVKKDSLPLKEDKKGKDKECLIDISNMSSIVIKNNKMDKRKFEGNENLLIGKKRKREKEKEKEKGKEKENFVSIVLKSEPTIGEVESAKNLKKNKKQRKNTPKKK